MSVRALVAAAISWSSGWRRRRAACWLAAVVVEVVDLVERRQSFSFSVVDFDSSTCHVFGCASYTVPAWTAFTGSTLSDPLRSDHGDLGWSGVRGVFWPSALRGGGRGSLQPHPCWWVVQAFRCPLIGSSCGVSWRVRGPLWASGAMATTGLCRAFDGGGLVHPFALSPYSCPCVIA